MSLTVKEIECREGNIFLDVEGYDFEEISIVQDNGEILNDCICMDRESARKLAIAILVDLLREPYNY